MKNQVIENVTAIRRILNSHILRMNVCQKEKHGKYIIV